MPNPILVSGTKNSAAIAAANTSATVTSTGSVTAGNLQIVAIEISGAVAPTAITAPGGWSTLLTTTTTAAGGVVSSAIFYKQATASGAFSGAFSWTTASTAGEWLFMEWRGAGASLIDGSVASALDLSGTQPTSPTITPGAGKVNDTLVCMLFAGIVGTSTIASPAGMSTILLVNGGASTTLFGAASLNLASASATGTKAWTLGTAQATLGVSFLIQQGPVWGWDTNAAGSNIVTLSPQAALPRRRGAARLRSEFAFPGPFVRMGFEVQPPPPPTKPRRIVGWPDFNEDGDESKFIFWRNAGWEIQLPQPPKPAGVKREPVLNVGNQGDEAPFIRWQNSGWEQTRSQEPSRAYSKAAATMRGDDGNENVVITATTTPWWALTEAQIRTRSIQLSATRLRTEFAYPIGVVPWSETPPPFLVPRFTTQRGAGAGGKSWSDDGNYAPEVVWYNAGWEIQPSQPPQRRKLPPSLGDDGIEASPTRATVPWWALTEAQLRAKPTRLAPILGDDGNYVPEIVWRNAGWEIQPSQPPQRRKSIPSLGDDGIENPQTRVTIPWWALTDAQLRARPLRLAFLGDDGTEAPFTPPPFVPSLWGSDQVVPLVRLNLQLRAATRLRTEFTYPIGVVPWSESPLPFLAPRLTQQRGAGAGGKSQYATFGNWQNLWDSLADLQTYRQPGRTKPLLPSGNVEFSPFKFVPFYYPQWWDPLYRRNWWKSVPTGLFTPDAQFVPPPPSTVIWLWPVLLP